MTEHKHVKRRIGDRMRRTGERYLTARWHTLAALAALAVDLSASPTMGPGATTPVLGTQAGTRGETPGSILRGVGVTAAHTARPLVRARRPPAAELVGLDLPSVGSATGWLTVVRSGRSLAIAPRSGVLRTEVADGVAHLLGESGAASSVARLARDIRDQGHEWILVLQATAPPGRPVSGPSVPPRIRVAGPCM